MFHGWTESPEQIEARKRRILKGYKAQRLAKLSKIERVRLILMVLGAKLAREQQL